MPAGTSLIVIVAGVSPGVAALADEITAGINPAMPVWWGRAPWSAPALGAWKSNATSGGLARRI